MLSIRSVSVFLFILFASYFSSSTFSDEMQNELRFGSVAMDIPAAMHRRLTPLTNYLEKALSMPVSLKLSPNMKAAIKEVADGRVELAYLTPVAYLKSHAAGQTRLVAKTVTNGKASFRLMIVVRKDSSINKPEDLFGKSFAFGDKAALLQRAAVVGAGVPLGRLGEYAFLGHYDNIVRGVLNGDFDAGIAKDTTALKWKGKGIRVLYSTPDLPPYNITASANMSDEVLEKLQTAFLSLDVNKREHYDIIKALDKRYTGFAPTSDAEYDVIRKLVAPFAKK